MRAAEAQIGRRDDRSLGDLTEFGESLGALNRGQRQHDPDRYSDAKDTDSKGGEVSLSGHQYPATSLLEMMDRSYRVIHIALQYVYARDRWRL